MQKQRTKTEDKVNPDTQAGSPLPACKRLPKEPEENLKQEQAPGLSFNLLQRSNKQAVLVTVLHSDREPTE